ncbi:Retrovirus-related Pol polyprotein from transposon 17.6,Retrovirus-related Pol polyprotein from transposon 297 [Mytilus edulis]|uniref:Retrovirus-related Pol polyprotein from transposon 17.6,Retrovirus-related Pol polyprotein from transposon 297 n=1 Tax=Mytilus edulis TaxID=6550 RepID=A0A8S3R9H8_MYTED|nr:Retrovirus-related Pol polyprotein from transposon 17.6,Retrovirus-related Pol polyprotein from transposon 297 [Mytilus edulis]
MGLKTAPNTFQLLMDKVLRGLKFRTCLCYLDDVLICSETFEKHLDDIKEIFKRFRDAGLKLGQKKCHFASETCIFLGHEISKHGIRPQKIGMKAIVDFPAPQNIKQLRRTIGLFNWFKKFIPNFSAIISPLTKLLKKNQKFEWKIEQSTAFQNLKTHLVNTDNLSFPVSIYRLYWLWILHQRE